VFNRQSVETAMHSVINRLKLIKQTPENGLALFCGLVSVNHSSQRGGMSDSMMSASAASSSYSTENASGGVVGSIGGGSSKNEAMKKVCIVLEPPKAPLKRGLYYCDSRFHAEDLLDQMDELENSENFGFVVMNGSSVLIATLRGSRHRVLYEKSIHLPKKHGKGGQSKERFARLRQEAIDLWIKTVAEKANDYFLSSNREKVLVNGIIIAGSANLKQQLFGDASKLMDYRLASRILNVVDVQYGSTAGLLEAIDKTKKLFQNVRFSQEQKLLESFMNTIVQTQNKVAFGVQETMYALIDVGAVEKLILYEQLDVLRCVFGPTPFNNTDAASNTALEVKYLTREKLSNYMKRNSDHCLIEHQLLIDWLLDEDRAQQQFGCSVEIVSNATPEGYQFTLGFGGIGAWLRYDVDIDNLMHSHETSFTGAHDDGADDGTADYDSDLDGFL